MRPFAGSPETRSSIIVCPQTGSATVGNFNRDKSEWNWLRRLGFAVFHLRFPVPGYEASAADVQWALQEARLQARAWHLDPGRVGVLGVSEGCPLIAQALAQATLGQRAPAFGILISPLLIGPTDLEARDPGTPISSLVGPDCDRPPLPPTLLLASTEDHRLRADPRHDAFLAIRRHWMASEMHILAPAYRRTVDLSSDPRVAFDPWQHTVAEWLRFHDWIPHP